MGPFLRKDILVFWRDRKEVLVSLLLPIILIVVLSIAFSGLFNNDSETINLNVAMVQEDNEVEGYEAFSDTIAKMELDNNEKEMILQQALQLSPVRLIHDFFHSPDMNDWMHLEELSEKDAIDALEAGEIDAIVKVPSGFTYDFLSHLLAGQKSDVALKIVAEKHSNEVNILEKVVSEFINTLNLNFAIGSTAGAEIQEPELPLGGTEVIEGIDPFNMTQYFTIAMATLFALFISQTVAIKTVTEKREQVFNRIIITNSKPLHYLMGKVFSTFFLTWLQMMVTITVIQLILDVFPDKTFEFWVGLIAVLTVYSLIVAGLSAIFTSITLNIENTNAVNGILTFIVMTFAILGGNFFPLQGLPTPIQIIGEWTPNGLTQTVLLEWVQLSDLSNLFVPIAILLLFFVLCIIIGMAMFPRRGRA